MLVRVSAINRFLLCWLLLVIASCKSPMTDGTLKKIEKIEPAMFGATFEPQELSLGMVHFCPAIISQFKGVCGSGFILSEDGHILTNLHIIKSRSNNTPFTALDNFTADEGTKTDRLYDIASYFSKLDGKFFRPEVFKARLIKTGVTYSRDSVDCAIDNDVALLKVIDEDLVRFKQWTSPLIIQENGIAPSEQIFIYSKPADTFTNQPLRLKELVELLEVDKGLLNGSAGLTVGVLSSKSRKCLLSDSTLSIAKDKIQSTAPFIEGGSSGSAILNASGFAVGILAGGSSNNKFNLVNSVSGHPIEHVLQTLNLPSSIFSKADGPETQAGQLKQNKIAELRPLVAMKRELDEQYVEELLSTLANSTVKYQVEGYLGCYNARHPKEGSHSFRIKAIEIDYRLGSESKLRIKTGLSEPQINAIKFDAADVFGWRIFHYPFRKGSSEDYEGHSRFGYLFAKEAFTREKSWVNRILTLDLSGRPRLYNYEIPTFISSLSKQSDDPLDWHSCSTKKPRA